MKERGMKNFISKKKNAVGRNIQSNTREISLKIKVISLFLAMILIPLGIVGTLAYYSATTSISEQINFQSTALENEAEAKFEVIQEMKKFQIAELIKGIQSEIKGALKSMDENTQQVDEGCAGVEDAVGLFEELPTIVDAVNKAASEVSSVAQENAAGSEEAASAMQQVTSSSQKFSELAEQMGHLVSQFKIDDGANLSKTHQSSDQKEPYHPFSSSQKTADEKQKQYQYELDIENTSEYNEDEVEK